VWYTLSVTALWVALTRLRFFVAVFEVTNRHDYLPFSHVKHLSYHNSTIESYCELNCDIALVRLDIMQRCSPSYRDLHPPITKALEISISIRIDAKGIFTKTVQNYLSRITG